MYPLAACAAGALLGYMGKVRVNLTAIFLSCSLLVFLNAIGFTLKPYIILEREVGLLPRLLLVKMGIYAYPLILILLVIPPLLARIFVREERIKNSFLMGYLAMTLFTIISDALVFIGVGEV